MEIERYDEVLSIVDGDRNVKIKYDSKCNGIRLYWVKPNYGARKSDEYRLYAEHTLNSLILSDFEESSSVKKWFDDFSYKPRKN